MRKTFTTAVASVLTAGLVAAGCTNSEEPAPSQSSSNSSQASGHNQADARFAKAMIPHHRQAVQMADMVPSRSDDTQLRKLAGQIKDAQQPEIDKMGGWLRQWHAGKPEKGHHMSGMMSGDDMSKLKTARGKAFDRMWLRMMIKHHQGAVDMAKTELSQGSSSAAKRLSNSIIKSQRAEIGKMRGMLE